MTDARLPERWLNDRRLQRLSAEHFRTFINALLYAVANRTDGLIASDDVGLIPHWSANAAKAFVDAGLFAPRNEGWFIVDYLATQSSRSELETLENIRKRDRIKKQRKRAANNENAEEDIPTDSTVPGDIPGDSVGDVSPGTAQAGRQEGRHLKGVPRIATSTPATGVVTAALNCGTGLRSSAATALNQPASRRVKRLPNSLIGGVDP